jgi:hypothetical protein
MKTSPDFETLPAFYKHYVMQIQELDVMDALQLSGTKMLSLLKSISEDQGEYRYQEEKWSIKELICHVMDAERVFAYRALRFSRNDTTVLPGFDENLYAPNANAHGRSLATLVTEVAHLRQSTVDLFSSFTPEMLARTGNANGSILSVLNLGYIIAGHEMHHGKILSERYLKVNNG